MSSFNSIFVVIVSMFCFSSGNKISDNYVKQICTNPSIKIDSMVQIYGTDIMYLIAGSLIYKMKIRVDGFAVIKETKSLKNWNPDISPQINMIYTTKLDPKNISLINCKQMKEWIIRHEDNHNFGSIASGDCYGIIGFTLDPKTGYQYFFDYIQNKDELFIKDNQLNQWFLTVDDSQPMIIKLNEKVWNGIGSQRKQELPFGTKTFTTIKGQLINNGIIHEKDWILFAGRYYCRVNLIKWELCQTKEINEWILNCNSTFVDKEEEKSVHQNVDISLYLVIVFTIILITLMAVGIIGLFIFKEYKKRGTYLKSSTSK